MLIRWLLTDQTTGRWIATIYAEKYELADPSDPTQAHNFWIGTTVVGSVDRTSGVNVGDSGGRENA